jgi:hypothetical protein
MILINLNNLLRSYACIKLYGWYIYGINGTHTSGPNAKFQFSETGFIGNAD